VIDGLWVSEQIMALLFKFKSRECCLPIESIGHLIMCDKKENGRERRDRMSTFELIEPKSSSSALFTQLIIHEERIFQCRMTITIYIGKLPPSRGYSSQVNGPKRKFDLEVKNS